MSEKAIVEARMVAARIHFSRAREMGARVTGAGLGVLFMAAEIKEVHCYKTAKLRHQSVHFRNACPGFPRIQA
jgi:hypothetical protein